MMHDDGNYTLTFENGSTITAINRDSISAPSIDYTLSTSGITLDYDNISTNTITFDPAWTSPLATKSELDEMRTIYEYGTVELNSRIDYLESRLERILEFISQSVKDTGAISEQDLATLLLL